MKVILEKFLDSDKKDVFLLMDDLCNQYVLTEFEFNTIRTMILHTVSLCKKRSKTYSHFNNLLRSIPKEEMVNA